MGVGYFSAAEGIVGDSVLHVIEENLTAAELKHASLRQIAEESIHMDSLLHIIGSLNMDIDEVSRALFRHPQCAEEECLHHAPDAGIEDGHRPDADHSTSKSSPKPSSGSPK